MRPLRQLLVLGLVALVLAALLPAASADVVHLRTGEAVKGRPIQERSTEAYLAVEDFLTGALRRFAWNALDPADREAIQERWGWTNTGENVVVGERVVIRLDDGSTEELRGIVESETDTMLQLRVDGRLVPIEKSRIIDRDDEEMDIRDVYSPEQLVERYIKAKLQTGVDLNDAESLKTLDHWHFGIYAEWVGALEIAKEHFAVAAADEEFLKKEIAQTRLERVEARLKDVAALATLKDARFKLRMSLFRKVKAMIDVFPETHPNASEPVLADVEELRSQLAAKRTTVLQGVAKSHFVDIVKSLIKEKLREKDIAITDITSWTRRELPEAAFTRLAEKKMARYDDVTPEEAKTLWDGRSKRTWKRVAYGSGTFIVDPPKIKPPKQRRGGGRGRGGGSGGGAVEIPKPPTRDQWWTKVGTRERENWVLAYFIERSELFELGEPDHRPCSVCHGAGLISKVLQTGDTLTYLCTRCGGAQLDRIAKYR